MSPTDVKATNGTENKIGWSFFNPLDNFLKAARGALVFSLSPVPLLINMDTGRDENPV